MTWIKENKFLAGLIAGSVLAAALLAFVAMKGGQRYTKAKEEFDAAASEASGIESMPLYPTAENRDGKRKAVDEYKESVDSLQKAFDSFRPKELPNIPPQEFTNRLKAVNEEVRKAFDESATNIPDGFFSGFDAYKDKLVSEKNTGILTYQLDAVHALLLELAKAGVSEVKNIHRPLLAEEKGESYQPGDQDVARPLPLEITFRAPEKAVRLFISAITKPDQRYWVIRSLRFTNSKAEPPRGSDAKFEKPATTPGAGDAAAAPFGGAFVLPGDEPAPAAEAAAATPQVPAPAETSRILAQVLGNEQVQVFLRLDLMQFLPAKELP